MSERVSRNLPGGWRTETMENPLSVMTNSPSPDTQNNAAEPRSVQIAHVLFVDIVGFSRETTAVQSRQIERLTAAVTSAPAYAEARRRDAVLPVPSGDGMAILFTDDVTAPVRCAVEVSRALHPLSGKAPEIPVRMGVHSGLIQRQMDIAGKENVVGEGINTAQRVMDFGDAGHILLSAQYATWLSQFEEWQPFILPLGEVTAKHGLRLTLFGLRGDDFGSSLPPARLAGTSRANGQTPQTPQIALLYKSDTSAKDHDRSAERVLAFLEERLRAEGFDVFRDRARRINRNWFDTVDEKMRGAEAVVAIVSPQSLRSEMLEYEIEAAHDQKQKTGKPLILPVSIGMGEVTLEGPIAAIISPLPRFHWEHEGDDQRLAAELLSAIREPLKPRTEEIKLEPVGGAVSPDSPFYIERACDSELGNALDANESILLIKGARQMGKTSLEGRGVQRVRKRGSRVTITDFQKLGTAQMASEDVLYRLLAATLARQLGFTYDFAGEWDDIFGANLNMENFLRELLEASDTPLVWFMDEVDKLFLAPFASDFFGLVRSWHNSRSTEPGGPWDKLTVVIAYATEAHLFIQDLNQSPFNVGRRIDLEDFNLQQVIDLSGRYGGPLRTYREAEELYALIGGQPFLTRKALDVLTTGRWDFAGLIAEADRDDGPFSDHLKRMLVAVSRLSHVAAYAHSILNGTATPRSDQDAYYRLLAAGIVRQDRDGSVRFRHDLYRRYLNAHLE